MAKPEWIIVSEAAAVVTDRVGCSVGRSQAVVRAARASGEVRSRRGPALLVADDGLMGYGVPEDQISSADFLDWLDRNYPQAKPVVAGGRRGAKAKADWEAVGLALRHEVKLRGMPGPDNGDPKWRFQADVERWAADFLDDRQESVTESTIRERIRKALQEIEAGN